jgi:hypothetical protein
MIPSTTHASLHRLLLSFIAQTRFISANIDAMRNERDCEIQNRFFEGACFRKKKEKSKEEMNGRWRFAVGSQDFSDSDGWGDFDMFSWASSFVEFQAAPCQSK